MIRLGTFQLTERIGQGGMGEVWAASHAQGGDPVAVKILSAEALRDVVYRSAFRNEVRSVAALRHPHIVRVYEHGEVTDAEARQASSLVSGMSYLVMELAGGGSLAPRRGRLAWPELRAALLALLDALAHAHARGVIHRDLKPGNVLLGRRRPAIKLTDFGLAHAVDRAFPWQASSTAGTPSYMAPEQFVGEWRDFGPWTDLYALGCVAWAMATGHPPFRVPAREQAMEAHLGASLPDLDAKMAVPDGLEDWLRTLLEKDLKYRPSSAAEAAWTLRRLPEMAGEPPPKVLRDRPARWLPEALQITTLAWRDPLRTPAEDGAALPFPEDWREVGGEEDNPLRGTGLGLFGLRAVPMVGREAERDALWQALGRVWTERRPAAVLLRGQPGSGKSRLARWLLERSAELGVATPLRSTHGASTPGFAGLERALARWFRTVGLDEDEVRYRVRVALSAWGEPDPREVDAYVDVASAWAREGEQRRVTPGRRRGGVIRRFLERLATRHPVVVVLEDVQWGAEALELVRDLLARGAESPAVLFVLTWREDFAGHEESAALVEAIRRDPYALDLPVAPLDPEATRHLVAELAGLDPKLSEEVAQRSEGIPLFAVQLVTDWVDRQVLATGADGYRLKPGTPEQLPDDLHQIWVERLERLIEGREASDRAALEIAAALGDEVDVLEWSEACAEAGIATPVDLVERMLDHNLATRVQGGARFSFAHGMMRESLERIARESGRARAHHEACAVVVRRRGGRGMHERLGRHLLAAGRADAATTLLLEAARAASARGDHGHAEVLLGDVDRAIAAAGLAGSDRRRVEAWLVRSRVDTLRGEHTQAARWARIAAAAAEQYAWGDLHARAFGQLGWSFHVLGHPDEAAEFLGESVRLAEEARDDEVLAESLARLGEVERSAGRLPEATAAYQRALAVWKGTGSGAARCLLGLGSIARMEGDLEGARVRLSRARTLYEGLGEVRGVANAAANLSDIARQQGHGEEAVALSREALELYEAHDSAQSPFARLNLALALLAADQDEAAHALLRRCVLELHRQGWRALVAVARLGFLRGCARDGDWEGWDRHLRSAYELLTNARLHDPDIPWLLEMAAAAAREGGEEGRAREALRVAFEQWTGLGRSAEAQALAAELGRVS